MIGPRSPGDLAGERLVGDPVAGDRRLLLLDSLSLLLLARLS